MRAQLAAGLALALALAAPGRTADTGTLYATLAAQQDNAVLAIAAQEGGATALLKGSEQYTLFAPTDAAFKKLDDATIRALATRTEVVQRLVRCHLVPGKYTAADLRKRTGEMGEARGLGVLTTGGQPEFPLDQGMPRIRAFLKALEKGDHNMARETALPLLGFGPGLTPSGDDFVGAALFARQLVDDSREWLDVARALSEAITTRSNVISAALFRDLIVERTPQQRKIPGEASRDHRGHLRHLMDRGVPCDESGERRPRLCGFHALIRVRQHHVQPVRDRERHDVHGRDAADETDPTVQRRRKIVGVSSGNGRFGFQCTLEQFHVSQR